ncbi:2-hydroxyacid dehydrogenase [Amaricoccus solimangrovi]|uniref:2-hydroxyacid dehydrogenase n=1 Tax=Amaricoccus solimangrovi TaxID=2589815 RepID=A0A501WSQ3_9RHOB|nr:2-hydroxyacid dehydrogenase [Amaricoccus solimangrovi]TPE48826.1 2-hydroxyacid dehydrogenase [Amaricoccus solimangrovi]
MRVAVFSGKPYDEASLPNAPGAGRHDWHFWGEKLSPASLRLAEGRDAVCAFVNDDLSAPVIEGLAARGVRLIALRCAGYNNVDLAAAEAAGVAVGRVPAYSPHAVAEHAVALIMTLNRKTHRAYNRVRDGNFALDGLLGFDLAGKTVGVVGTGLIGAVLTRILTGFGCRVLAADPVENPECLALGVRYVPVGTLFAESDVISLQCPLTPGTHHLVDDAAIARMKPGVMIVNTSRGAIIDARAAIRGLKRGVIGGLCLDVYEEEAGIFFEDLSGRILQDDVLARLMTFPNVLITAHQGFFTAEALAAIAETTVRNLDAFEATGVPAHPLRTG